MNSKLVIAAAGAGKTTYLIEEALKRNNKVLITTYTRSNENEILNKIYSKLGCIPSNIEIQTWFEFLLRQGVRPFQGTMDNSLFEKNIGFFLSSNKSALYTKESDILKHYFNKKLQIFSDKITKFILKCNEKLNGLIISRISNIYSNIFIDEIQDMVGYDLDLLQLLIYSNSEILMVGDPRQTTYTTHPTDKNQKYQNGKIEEYINDIINKKQEICKIDKESLKLSHRNNEIICNFSSKLFPSFPKPSECKCNMCRNYGNDNHIGLFLLYQKDIPNYLEKYKPIQLRWNKKTKGYSNYEIYNFGEAKGLSFERVIIYPTNDMLNWIQNNNYNLADQTRAKFYVAITRARKSSTIVIDDNIDKRNIGDEYCFYEPL